MMIIPPLFNRAMCSTMYVLYLIIRVLASFGDTRIVGHVLYMTLNNMKQRI